MVFYHVLFETVWNFDFITNIESVNLWYFQTKYFAADIEIHYHRFLIINNKFQKNFLLSNQSITEKRSTIRGWMIFVKEILTQTQIARLQVIFRNILLYPVSVRNCPGPEFFVFCTSIIGVISRRSLVFFILLYGIKCHYKKGSLKMEFFKCKTIHSRLLCIAVLYTVLLR